jgi:hypothetical protein
LRALVLIAVAAAAAPSGVIHAKASESGGRGVIRARASKLRALQIRISARRDSLAARLAKASESGGRGVIRARASKLRSRLRAPTRSPVAGTTTHRM